MNVFRNAITAAALAIGLLTAIVPPAKAQTSVPVYFDPQADTYAEWQWDCIYYIDYLYIPDFPDPWRPGWYYGSDWYYGPDWDGWVPYGYWQPYVASSCFWVLADVWDVAVTEIQDTQPGCIYELTFTDNWYGTWLRTMTGDGEDQQFWDPLMYGYEITNVSAVEKCPVVASETFATVPSNRARTRLGVGESVKLKLSPDLDEECLITWSILDSAPGTLSGCTMQWGNCTGHEITFTAHDRESDPTIRATYGGETWDITFEVVEPSVVVILKDSPNVYHSHGQASVGFWGRAWYAPTDVSFSGIYVRERGYSSNPPSFNVPGVGTGIYSVWNGMQHPLGTWTQVIAGTEVWGSKDSTPDQIWSGNKSPPFNDGGTFTWNIPWEFKVGNGQGKVFATAAHVVVATSTGRTTLTKGHDETKEANDPESSW